MSGPPEPPLPRAPERLAEQLAGQLGVDADSLRVRLEPPRGARLEPLPAELPPAARRALEARGVERLYRHQARAFGVWRGGGNALVTTGTGSGKSLCYALAALDALARDPDARALCVFPTKALAHDQLPPLAALLGELPGVGADAVQAYDGDTPRHRRAAARRSARLLATNPDMLHGGILPHHPRWRALFENLQLVVIDELHVYRGVFGSHLANLLRRLKRVAARYGAHPRFVLASATLRDAEAHATRLLEAPVTHIDDDASASPGRLVALHNPPLVRPELGLRLPPTSAAVAIAARLLRQQRTVLLFARSRQGAERVALRLRAALPAGAPQVLVYRGGYLPRQRRAVEARLRDGSCGCVVATSALELGIDVGHLDAVVTLGWPGSVAALQQQLGRAGRRERRGLGVVVLGGDPLDQFLFRHPERVFGAAAERALCRPDHLAILLAHLRCALFEAPWEPSERFGDADPELSVALLAHLQRAGEALPLADGRSLWARDLYPAAEVSLRAAGGAPVLLERRRTTGSAPDSASGAAGTVLGTVDRASAPWMVHPGAIYLHEGERYRVEALDLDAGRAELQPVSTDAVTDAVTRTSLTVLEHHAERRVAGAAIGRGELRVSREVTGYKRLDLFTREVLSRHELQLPPTELLTDGYWIVPDEAAVAALRRAGLWGNDPNDYGPEWPRARDAARARDGHRCRGCGRPEAGARHHVHHRQPFRTFARPALAHALDNLVTLCAACHRAAEQAVQVRSGLAGVAHAARHLAPLQLLCGHDDLVLLADGDGELATALGAGRRPGIVAFDAAPGGLGLSAALYEEHESLMRAVREAVAACGCRDGCPSCVGAPGEHGRGAKEQALALLALLSPDPLGSGAGEAGAR